MASSLVALAVSLGAGCAGETGPTGEPGPPGDPGAKGDPGQDGEDGTATPSVSAVTPSLAYLERSVRVAISGSGTTWTDAVTVDFGDGITVDDVVVASPTAILATITVDPDAALGPRNVVVTGAEPATFTGGFEIAPPITASLEGTSAQGSVVLAHVDLKDLSTPFDTTNGLALLSLGADGSSAGQVSDGTPFAIDGVVFLDVDATAGATDVVVESGVDPISSRAVGALDVAERAPTTVTIGTDATGALAGAFDSALLQIDVPAHTLLELSLGTSSTDGAPFIILLPESGAFADLIDFSDTLSVTTGDTSETFYAVVWDNTGTTGVDFTLASHATTLTSESEPNGTSAQAGSPLSVPAAVEASISPSGDVDFFAVTAAAGDTITATTGPGGADTCGSAGAIDTVVAILDTDGTTELTSNDDIGFTNWCSSASVQVDTAGTYFVRVQSSDFSPDATYDYTLSIGVD